VDEAFNDIRMLNGIIQEVVADAPQSRRRRAREEATAQVCVCVLCVCVCVCVCVRVCGKRVWPCEG
jgi:hypothetical protein